MIDAEIIVQSKHDVSSQETLYVSPPKTQNKTKTQLSLAPKFSTFTHIQKSLFKDSFNYYL